VEIVFIIQKDGAADSVAVRASSGDSLLDAAALAAIYAAAPFKPPAAPVRLAVPVVFSLR
jgi:TonB family protein